MRLTDEEIREIRQTVLYRGPKCGKGISRNELAQQYGISTPAIASIRCKKTYKHVPDVEPIQSSNELKASIEQLLKKHQGKELK